METQYDLLGRDSQKQWESLWNEATGINDVRRLRETKAAQEAYRRSKGMKPRKTTRNNGSKLKPLILGV